MIKRLTFVLSIFFSFIISAHAKINITTFNGITYVENATVQELEELYKKHKYQRFHALDNNAYPAIFVKTLPSDFGDIKSQKYRNELFIRILTPLALKVNQELQNERNQLLKIESSLNKNQTLTEFEINRLDELAKKYDFFTRAKDLDRYKKQIANLKSRINIIPPSIFIAAAAMESNWGFSRVSLKANSLYKEKVWFTNEGLEPLENANDGYRFRIFNSLIDSMRSFALKFNSDINYQPVWFAREAKASTKDTLLGESMAYTLANSSNLPNFAGILTYTTAFYDLYSLDLGHLKIGE